MGVTVEGESVCGEVKGVCGRAVKLGMQKKSTYTSPILCKCYGHVHEMESEGQKYRLGFRTSLFKELTKSLDIGGMVLLKHPL